MEKKLVMCDTNIFIHWFNNHNETINRIEKIGLDCIVVSIITVMELVEGVDNSEQLNKLKKKIKNYHMIGFNNKVSELSLELVEKYKLSNNLQIPDAIIGATAIVHKIPLFTYNIKDFKFMPNIKLI